MPSITQAPQAPMLSAAPMALKMSTFQRGAEAKLPSFSERQMIQKCNTSCFHVLQIHNCNANAMSLKASFNDLQTPHHWWVNLRNNPISPPQWTQIHPTLFIVNATRNSSADPKMVQVFQKASDVRTFMLSSQRKYTPSFGTRTDFLRHACFNRHCPLWGLTDPNHTGFLA